MTPGVNWTLRIAPETLRRIRIWNAVYPRLAALIFQRFQDQLAVNPGACLGEMIVPTTNRVYHLTFPGHPGLPDSLVIVFAVGRDDNTHTLDVGGGRLSTRPGA
jgi:hypothetical protein